MAFDLAISHEDRNGWAAGEKDHLVINSVCLGDQEAIDGVGGGAACKVSQALVELGQLVHCIISHLHHPGVFVRTQLTSLNSLPYIRHSTALAWLELSTIQ